MEIVFSKMKKTERVLFLNLLHKNNLYKKQAWRGGVILDYFKNDQIKQIEELRLYKKHQ